MSKYILLDVNGTVGTDTVPILEKIENPDNFIWVDKVEAHVKLSTLATIKRLSDVIGIAVVVIDAKNQDVAQFYKKFGFFTANDSDLRLFLLVKSILDVS